MNEHDDLIDNYAGFKATANYRQYIDIEPNITVRDSFSTKDRYYFRPEEYVGSIKSSMKKSQSAYDNVGLIKQVIDLMGDFAVQGIRISHSNKKIERFFRRFWEKVDGDHVSERFLNTLYRLGNVAIYISYGKITRREKNRMVKAILPQIPFKYTFLNPINIDVDLNDLNLLTNKRTYKLSTTKYTKNTLSGDMESIDLSSEKLRVYHYKKDDWEIWAKPMIHAILDDILMYEKMKLADTSALDGAISNIRLWRLGSLDHKILPKAGAIDKLRDILAANTGGGTMDLIWGPEIDFKESNTQIYKFLGNEKYGPVLSSIYGGLGIPQTLTGSAQSSGFTNNFISLKTLIEKLEYGRSILIKFWKEQFEIVSKAMGFTESAELSFDHMVLSDETAEKNLLKELSDRHILSLETVRERLGESHDVENARIEKEQKDRDRGKIPPKADPFHNGNILLDYAKMALQQGLISIEDLTDIKKSDVVPIPTNNNQNIKKDNGRPPFSKDILPRKQKVVNPRSKAETLLWAIESYKKISDIMHPSLAHLYGANSLRELTKAQHQEFEQIKFIALCGLEPFSEITNETVFASIKKCQTPKDVSGLYADFLEKNNREPTIEEYRNMYCLAYIL